MSRSARGSSEMELLVSSLGIQCNSFFVSATLVWLLRLISRADATGAVSAQPISEQLLNVNVAPGASLYVGCGSVPFPSGGGVWGIGATGDLQDAEPLQGANRTQLKPQEAAKVVTSDACNFQQSNMKSTRHDGGSFVSSGAAGGAWSHSLFSFLPSWARRSLYRRALLPDQPQRQDISLFDRSGAIFQKCATVNNGDDQQSASISLLIDNTLVSSFPNNMTGLILSDNVTGLLVTDSSYPSAGVVNGIQTFRIQSLKAGEYLLIKYNASLSSGLATDGLQLSLPAQLSFQNSSAVAGTSLRLMAAFTVTAKENIKVLPNHGLHALGFVIGFLVSFLLTCAVLLVLRYTKRLNCRCLGNLHGTNCEPKLGKSQSNSPDNVNEDFNMPDKMIDILAFEEPENMLQALDDSEIVNLTHADAYLEACRIHVCKDIIGISLKNMAATVHLPHYEVKRLTAAMSEQWINLEKQIQEEHQRKIVALTAECHLDTRKQVDMQERKQKAVYEEAEEKFRHAGEKSLTEYRLLLDKLHDMERAEMMKLLMYKQEEDFAKARRELSVCHRTELLGIFSEQLHDSVAKGNITADAGTAVIENHFKIQEEAEDLLDFIQADKKCRMNRTLAARKNIIYIMQLCDSRSRCLLNAFIYCLSIKTSYEFTLILISPKMCQRSLGKFCFEPIKMTCSLSLYFSLTRALVRRHHILWNKVHYSGSLYHDLLLHANCLFRVMCPCELLMFSRAGHMNENQAELLMCRAQAEVSRVKQKMDNVLKLEKRKLHQKLGSKRKKLLVQKLKEQKKEMGLIQETFACATDVPHYLGCWKKLCSDHCQQMEELYEKQDSDALEELRGLRWSLTEKAVEDLGHIPDTVIMHDMLKLNVPRQHLLQVLEEHKREMALLVQQLEKEESDKAADARTSLEGARRKLDEEFKLGLKEQKNLRQWEQQLYRKILLLPLSMSEEDIQKVRHEFQCGFSEMDLTLALPKIQGRALLQAYLTEWRITELLKIDKDIPEFETQSNSKMKKQSLDKTVELRKKSAEDKILIYEAQITDDKIKQVRGELLLQRVHQLKAREYKLGESLAALQFQLVNQRSKALEVHAALLRLQSLLLEEMGRIHPASNAEYKKALEVQIQEIRDIEVGLIDWESLEAVNDSDDKILSPFHMEASTEEDLSLPLSSTLRLALNRRKLITNACRDRLQMEELDYALTEWRQERAQMDAFHRLYNQDIRLAAYLTKGSKLPEGLLHRALSILLPSSSESEILSLLHSLGHKYSENVTETDSHEDESDSWGKRKHQELWTVIEKRLKGGLVNKEHEKASFTGRKKRSILKKKRLRPVKRVSFSHTENFSRLLQAQGHSDQLERTREIDLPDVEEKLFVFRAPNQAPISPSKGKKKRSFLNNLKKNVRSPV
eukprot:XP_012811446.1 PREDICTED: limbin [Xenopus tropicalis]